MTNGTIDPPLLTRNYSIILSVSLFLLIGAGIYFGVVLWLGWKQIAFVFNQLGMLMLFAGGSVASIAYILRLARWHFVLLRFGYRISIWNNFKVYLAGLALTASPGKLGETVRSVLLLPYGVKAQHSLGAFLADRLSDVLGICLLGVLAGLMAGKSVWLLTLVFTSLTLGSCLFRYAITHHRGERFLQRAIKKIRWLPLRGGQAVLNSWARLWSPGKVVCFVMIAMMAYGLQAWVFGWFCALTGISVSTAEAGYIFVLATLFGAASMIPGGLGAMEAALVFQLVASGADQGVAVSVAIATRMVTFWLSFVVGFCALLVSTRGLIVITKKIA